MNGNRRWAGVLRVGQPRLWLRLLRHMSSVFCIDEDIMPDLSQLPTWLPERFSVAQHMPDDSLFWGCDEHDS